MCFDCHVTNSVIPLSTLRLPQVPCDYRLTTLVCSVSSDSNMCPLPQQLYTCMYSFASTGNMTKALLCISLHIWRRWSCLAARRVATWWDKLVVACMPACRHMGGGQPLAAPILSASAASPSCGATARAEGAGIRC